MKLINDMADNILVSNGEGIFGVIERNDDRYSLLTSKPIIGTDEIYFSDTSVGHPILVKFRGLNGFNGGTYRHDITSMICYCIGDKNHTHKKYVSVTLTFPDIFYSRDRSYPDVELVYDDDISITVSHIAGKVLDFSLLSKGEKIDPMLKIDFCIRKGISNIKEIEELSFRIESALMVLCGDSVFYKYITCGDDKGYGADEIVFNRPRFENYTIQDNQKIPADLPIVIGNTLKVDPAPIFLWRGFCMSEKNRTRYIENRLYYLLVCIERIYDLSINKGNEPQRQKDFDLFLKRIKNNIDISDDKNAKDCFKFIKGMKKQYIHKDPYDAKMKKLLEAIGCDKNVNKDFCSDSAIIRNSIMHTGMLPNTFLDGDKDIFKYEEDLKDVAQRSLLWYLGCNYL